MKRVWLALSLGCGSVASRPTIANTGAEGGRGGVIPFQLVLIGPLLAPVWIAGLVALLRNRDMRRYRSFAVAYLLMIPLAILLPITVVVRVSHGVAMQRRCRGLRTQQKAGSYLRSRGAESECGG